jgi:2-polyprenyl-6-methoxyphenol hydroxylase-like FAD-dependent oxidoreductase
MSELLVVGGGVAGLSAAMLLARDGHRVTVLERDPAPPPSPERAWSGWERRGVTQFRLPHLFLARFTEILTAEAPDVLTALEDAGAFRSNRILQLPESVTGGRRPGDERFDQVTGRRPLVEAVLAAVAEAERGVVVRRGVAVRGLATDDAPRGEHPRVRGVVTDARETIEADLLIDASGRRSRLPDWLEAAGAQVPSEERADGASIYFGRHYRSPDGAMPAMLAPPLQPYRSLSIVTLVADNGHWSVVIYASAKDRLLRRAAHAEVWEALVRSYPLAAHWTDAEPVTGIDVMANIPDRVRRYDPAAAASGVVAIGDASACTNPSLGRGASFALLHAVTLRDVLREVGLHDRHAFADTWQQAAAERVEPLVDDTLRADRHRRAQIEVELTGREYRTDDPAWNVGTALMAAAPHDPEVLRAAMAVGGALERGVDALRRPGVMEAITRLGPLPPLPGPDRGEVEAIVEQASRQAA